jgi:hypothetical protein
MFTLPRVRPRLSAKKILKRTEKFSIKNKSIAGGFAGIDISLAKGFRLNVEEQRLLTPLAIVGITQKKKIGQRF